MIYGKNVTNLGRKKKTNDWQDIIGTMPSITGEQQAVNTPLSNYLAEALAGIGNQPTFNEWSKTNVPSVFSGALGGQLQNAFSEALSGEVPNMFGGELGSEAMAGYKQAMSGIAPDMFGGELGAQAKTAFQEAMSPTSANMFGGELGGAAKSAYAEALAGKPVDYNPSGANFMQNVIPAIKESYVGTGAITGTEVGDRINREASVRMENIANIRAGLYDQAKQRQAMAAGNYQQSWANMNEAANQRKLAAASSYQQQYQNQLGIAYQNYVGQNPDASTILQAALNYLNIPMMAAYQKPTDETGQPVGTAPAKPARSSANYVGNKWGQVFVADIYGGKYI